jgi:hypothetical protein
LPPWATVVPDEEMANGVETQDRRGLKG